MSSHCQYCYKGSAIGHAVSHAKNRTRRIFFPNLQKLKVLKRGLLIRVVFCTSCIKRLRKDERIGVFTLPKVAPVIDNKPKEILKSVSVKKRVEIPVEAPKEKARPVMNIEDIVGKKK